MLKCKLFDKMSTRKHDVFDELSQWILLEILILHEIFLANLLKNFARKDFFVSFFLRTLIGR